MWSPTLLLLALVPPTLLLLALVPPTTPGRLRGEEEWRPAPPRHLASFRARQARKVAEGRDRATSTMCLPLARSPYIVGGSVVARHARPWLAAIFIDSAWFCSGSLVTRLAGNPGYILDIS